MLSAKSNCHALGSKEPRLLAVVLFEKTPQASLTNLFVLHEMK